MSPSRTPFPEGWKEEFFKKADLDLSFERLKDCRHFHAHTLRGLIRSLQLRTDEAGKYFSRARKGFLKVEKTAPNLMYVFLLEAFRFENALLEAPVERGLPLPRTRFPELPEEVEQRYSEVVFALNFRKQTEGILRLHIGELEEATELFRELIEEQRESIPDQLACYYMGLGCCEHNLGNEAATARAFEDAGYTVLSYEETFRKVHCAALLTALYQVLENPKVSQEWRLMSQPCP